MISLFKSNDPLKLVLGIFVFLIFLAPYFWINHPYTLPNLVHNIIGAKVSSGFWLYKDIWDYEGLFTAYTFGLSNIFVDVSFWNKTIAIIVIIFIIIQVSFSMNSNETYTQKNYLTTYFLAIGFMASFTLVELSPQLLSLLFLSFAMHIVLKHFSKHLSDEDRMLLGLWHGIASMYYFPSTVFFVLHLLFFAAFTKLKLSSYFLSLLGFSIPYVFVGIIYYTQGALGDFINRGLLSYFQFHLRQNVGLQNIILISLPLLIPIIFAFVKLSTAIHNNIQSTCKGLMMLWLVGIVIIVIWSNYDVYNLCYLCIPFAYLTSYFFLYQRNSLFKTIYSIILPLSILLIHWGGLLNFFPNSPYGSIVLNQLPKQSGKKILVLGDDVSKYQGNTLATKYFFWPMAQKHFKKINTYAGITMIYIGITEDKPEVIIDEKQLMPKLLSHIPEIGNNYSKINHNTYYLKK